ncbi:2-keto-4-pentenoate hydratase/2-oxohepta-3-ene-1,7-dioic acid hydratase in catechol pathway [Mobiluncus mulieris]|uniref:Ureidoglycolate lyase n=1 Tax=Mobiluncus mulieris TaxID=2052 RepID=A0A8G2HU66_9ACTO|nr:fumarylacetoacetate hydrolase family protein [Mobiluncus mulieris]EEJ54718.1 FAH family protein [Mobiluncus mulieris ATCC 35243]MBB5846689.1 2-keto-4-pentenoate hydratase/2-oxohepta-3-ene-1,7-dioic acid hydratase in catechol pathway [Mobiluncus mulieris]MCV0011831.1 fumarylacetoacetate hydrolase family protein [Mobiluncus mulieris]NMW62898.1 fumarylacetoacetate hydrolase family protein [Mobiluncus mulieris]PNL44233.1 2-hydroxyhepta-2,4-diene-1,7-dioate isomerase [Mobiluncus mulieris]
MRVIRFDKGDGTYGFGVLEDDSTRVMVLAENPLYSPGKINATGQILQLEDVRLVAPVIPASKLVGVGANFYAPGAEHTPPESDPILFLKPNTTVIGPGAPIMLPKWAKEIVHEAEIGVVIKHPAKDIDPAHWKDYVFGYTVVNDLTARDAMAVDKTWMRGKSFDTACPIGPWIVVDPDLDPQNLRIRSWVDSELRQDDTSANMIHSVAKLVAYISRVTTLLPGDVILTGTPAGSGTLEDGQTMTCEVEGIGTLTNPVRR